MEAISLLQIAPPADQELAHALFAGELALSSIDFYVLAGRSSEKWCTAWFLTLAIVRRDIPPR